MMNGNGSSSKSTQQLVTPAAGNLKGLLSGGSGGGDKPPRHPSSMKSVHQLDGAGRGNKRPAIPTVSAGGKEREPFQCSQCESFFMSEEDLQSHIRRCHVQRSWRRAKEEAPRPPPSVPSSVSQTGKGGPSEVSIQQQQPSQQQLAEQAAPAEAPASPAEQAAPAEALASPAVPFAIDLNVPAPEAEEEKRSSG
jgi:hypothetical protein